MGKVTLVGSSGYMGGIFLDPRAGLAPMLFVNPRNSWLGS